MLQPLNEVRVAMAPQPLAHEALLKRSVVVQHCAKSLEQKYPSVGYRSNQAQWRPRSIGAPASSVRSVAQTLGRCSALCQDP